MTEGSTRMSFTPVEVRHIELRRGLLGFRKSGVRNAMDDIADSFEVVWRERADLAQRVEDLEAELGRHLELENLLRSTLVSAERAAQDLKEQARREADVIVSEANGEARRIVRDAITEKERLGAEARRVQAILRSALEVVESQWSASKDATEEPSQGPASGPNALPSIGEQGVRKLIS